MLRSSESDFSVVRKKILQVSSVMGFALIVGQAQVCYGQDSQPAPAPAAPIVSTPVSTPAATTNAPAPAVVPKLPNAVAILDLGIRQEHQDFFYDEKQAGKSSYSKKRSPGVAAPGAEGGMGGTSNESSLSESSYSKQYGHKTRVSYKEIKGLMVDVRSALRNAGYTVIRPKGMMAKKMAAGELTTVNERIAAGDFGNAQYVMIPSVVDASVRETQEAIQGTSDYNNKFEMNLTVEFTMVNTDTQAVVASFNASGSGSDAYLGKAHVKHVPDIARAKREMLTSFGADARKKLMEQLPKPGADGIIVEPKPGTATSGSFSDGDPKTLKVYRVTESEKTTDKDGASSEKTKEEMRIYRK
jgi:hypothetical protein